MSLSFAVNKQHLANLSRSTGVPRGIYALLQRAGVPVLQPGERTRWQLVAVPGITFAARPTDEVVEFEHHAEHGLRTILRRITGVLYPEPGYYASYCGTGDRRCGTSCDC